MAEADPLALHHVDAHRRRIEQQIDHMIVEQVDLVDVEQAAIGRRQHARLEVALAVLDGLLDVEGADNAIFGRADRQIDEAGAAADRRQLLAGRQAVAAVVAQRIEAAGIAGERAIGHHLDLGQERGQGARRGGLGGAALAADQHPADGVADGVQDQGALHALLADDGGERIRSDRWHRQCSGLDFRSDYTTGGTKDERRRDEDAGERHDTNAERSGLPTGSGLADGRPEAGETAVSAAGGAVKSWPQAAACGPNS